MTDDVTYYVGPEPILLRPPDDLFDNDGAVSRWIEASIFVALTLATGRRPSRDGSAGERRTTPSPRGPTRKASGLAQQRTSKGPSSRFHPDLIAKKF
jgi:hypothetical protein